MYNIIDFDYGHINKILCIDELYYYYVELVGYYNSIYL